MIWGYPWVCTPSLGNLHMCFLQEGHVNDFKWAIRVGQVIIHDHTWDSIVPHVFNKAIQSYPYTSKDLLRLYLELFFWGPNTFSDGIWSTGNGQCTIDCHVSLPTLESVPASPAAPSQLPRLVQQNLQQVHVISSSLEWRELVLQA